MSEDFISTVLLIIKTEYLGILLLKFPIYQTMSLYLLFFPKDAN